MKTTGYHLAAWFDTTDARMNKMFHNLKEYYEIVNGSPPSIRILPLRFRIVYRNTFILKITLSNLQSFRVIPALIASQSEQYSVQV